MWNNKTVSLILPVFNEEGYIDEAVKDFSLPVVDEIIVIDNNSTDQTAQKVLKYKHVLLFHEKRQGYGFALQAGYRKATGDYIITTEPDATFIGRDILKLLAYAEDFEVVFGSRTNTALVWEGANMHSFLLAGNWTVAKLIELIFNTSTLSDVGCTMKIIRRDALHRIENQFTEGRDCFSVEIMLLAIINKLRFIEIPINYKSRVGISKITGNIKKAIKVGLCMICIIIKYRLKTIYNVAKG